MKKFLVFLLFIFSLTGCKNSETEKRVIVSTIFPSYDFARAVTENSDFEVSMLIKPGGEVHDYEPTPQDILKIKNSSIFIYVGGESDEWVKDILNEIDFNKTKVIKLFDLVDTYEEEIVEGMEGETELEADEHVWTSPLNAIKIVEGIKKEVINVDSENKELYENNASNYIEKLQKIDSDLRLLINGAKRTILVFGDRFPFRYLANDYGLTYYAAFPGCSEMTEASAKTISFLIDKVKSEKIPVVFTIELSNKKIAEAISLETGAKVLELHSAHNVSLADFESGITYVDIMENNIKALSEALN